ncbi:4Fe-4S binding protein [Phototrophicus methaneseepsis]|uniref:4Fe-4S binding protein n=1 Tax=Phototrophicus methaneseepsis TaxID=2710758 RepID=A0A7S8IEK8_9CHLR|nr:4Fe-4S binding protein [Phototrophicus methaneseepsis]QPC82696.1 4Fe-4S binding protein [Phototrophicus methaneseepsis]
MPAKPGTRRKKRDNFNERALIVPAMLMLVLWVVAAVAWSQSGDALLTAFFVYVGIFIGVGIGSYIALAEHERDTGRRLIMVMMGGLLLVIALFSDHGNMQVEGLFWALLAGFAPYILLHYALAKVLGPLVFGRIWCGWACWFAMIFDLMPYKHSRYRLPRRWGWVRYIHFITSFIVVSVLWLVFQYNGALGETGLLWFIGGLLLYDVLGIGLGLLLKDNRAFCKYLCPISVMMKTTSRFSLLKVAGNPDAGCETCNVCVEMCPMNIDIPKYIKNGQRVLSTECTLCQTCINLCPEDALWLSFGLDVGGEEHIDYVPPRRRSV